MVNEKIVKLSKIGKIEFKSPLEIELQFFEKGNGVIASLLDGSGQPYVFGYSSSDEKRALNRLANQIKTYLDEYNSKTAEYHPKFLEKLKGLADLVVQ